MPDLTMQFMPPRPGDSARYLCMSCHHRFSGVVPSWPLLGLSFLVKKGPKCPKCGSNHAIRDPRILY